MSKGGLVAAKVVALALVSGCQVVGGIHERDLVLEPADGSDDANDSSTVEPRPDGAADAVTPGEGSTFVDGGDAMAPEDRDIRMDTGPIEDARIIDAADGGPLVSPSMFTHVSAAGDRTCGVRSGADIVCWGQPFANAPPSGAFAKVAVGGGHACGLTSAGVIMCWGINAHGETNVPSGTFKDVTLGDSHSCAQRLDNSIVCWGNDQYGQSSPVLSSYGQLTAGGNRTCALGFDYVASCWGEGAGLQARPVTHFTSIATGPFESCGTRKDLPMAISCWNPNGSERSFQHPGNFTQLSVGPSQVCAVDASYALSCWNGDDAGVLQVPPGKFKLVTVGYGHVCALKDDSRVVCWGKNDLGQATPR
jgi:hypothetical protein